MHRVEIADYHQERDMAELLDEIDPGGILREELIKPMGITARQLAADIDVSPSRGRRSSGSDSGSDHTKAGKQRALEWMTAFIYPCSHRKQVMRY